MCGEGACALLTTRASLTCEAVGRHGKFEMVSEHQPLPMLFALCAATFPLRWCVSHWYLAPDRFFNALTYARHPIASQLQTTQFSFYDNELVCDGKTPHPEECTVQLTVGPCGGIEYPWSTRTCLRLNKPSYAMVFAYTCKNESRVVPRCLTLTPSLEAYCRMYEFPGDGAMVSTALQNSSNAYNTTLPYTHTPPMPPDSDYAFVVDHATEIEVDMRGLAIFASPRSVYYVNITPSPSPPSPPPSAPPLFPGQHIGEQIDIDAVVANPYLEASELADAIARYIHRNITEQQLVPRTNFTNQSTVSGAATENISIADIDSIPQPGRRLQDVTFPSSIADECKSANISSLVRIRITLFVLLDDIVGNVGTMLALSALNDYNSLVDELIEIVPVLCTEPTVQRTSFRPPTPPQLLPPPPPSIPPLPPYPPYSPSPPLSPPRQTPRPTVAATPPTDDSTNLLAPILNALVGLCAIGCCCCVQAAWNGILTHRRRTTSTAMYSGSGSGNKIGGGNGSAQTRGPTSALSSRAPKYNTLDRSVT